MQSLHNKAILTAGGYSVAILKCGPNIFLYDSHSIDKNDYSTENGVSCLLRTDASVALKYLSTLIHINQQPKRAPHGNNDTSFYYEIRPLKCKMHSAEATRVQTNNKKRKPQDICLKKTSLTPWQVRIIHRMQLKT